MAAISRATPITLRQSGRLGVISISKTVSDSPRAEASRSPTDSEGSRRIMPLRSSPRPSSPSLQSMPSDVWPRMTLCSRIKPSGNSVPGRAIGESIPTSAFGAPQTTEIFPWPVSTLHRCNLSALGCGSMVSIRPTKTVSR